MTQLSFDLAPKPVYRPLNNQQRLTLELLQSGWATFLDAIQQKGICALSQRVGELERMKCFAIEYGWLDLPNGKRVRKYRITP